MKQKEYLLLIIFNFDIETIILETITIPDVIYYLAGLTCLEDLMI